MRRVLAGLLVVLFSAVPVLAEGFDVNSPAGQAWAAVDFTTLLGNLAYVLGGVVAAAVALYMCFLAVKRAMRYAARAAG